MGFIENAALIPSVKVDGNLATPDDANLIRQDLLDLRTAIVSPAAPSLQAFGTAATGWTAGTGESAPRYYKDSTGRIWLMGKLTATAEVNAVFSSLNGLGAGYRPSSRSFIIQCGMYWASGDSVVTATVTINTDGSIVGTPGPDYSSISSFETGDEIHLDGVSSCPERKAMPYPYRYPYVIGVMPTAEGTGTAGAPGIFWDQESLSVDFDFLNGDLVSDDGLGTAIFLSVFEDRRANAGDSLPDDADPDLRGWWGDDFPVVPEDKRGSRLWLLSNAPATQETLDRAKEYTAESLQWVLDDKVSNRVDVVTEFISAEWMGITVTVYRPAQDPVTFRYHYNWIAQEGVRA